MATITKPAAGSSAARTASTTAPKGIDDPAAFVSSLTPEQRQQFMNQFRLAQQEDVNPLLERKSELEAELEQLNQKIAAIRPTTDTLGLFRAVRKAVKNGKTQLAEIAEAANSDEATVEELLKKHLEGKNGKDPIFMHDKDGYKINTKTKK